jgi:hypothetical protein
VRWRRVATAVLVCEVGNSDGLLTDSDGDKSGFSGGGIDSSICCLKAVVKLMDEAAS